MIATIDLAAYIRHRWKYLHMWRGLRDNAWDTESRGKYAEWADEEKSELLACLKERRAGRGKGR